MKGGESSKFKKTEDGCAADGGCTPPATRRDGACAGVCGLNVLKRRQQQRKHNKIKKIIIRKKKNGFVLNLSPIEKNQMERERETLVGVGGGGGVWGGEE
ncbi:unnamed protein product, partial [Boreogadus saida]